MPIYSYPAVSRYRENSWKQLEAVKEPQSLLCSIKGCHLMEYSSSQAV